MTVNSANNKKSGIIERFFDVYRKNPREISLIQMGCNLAARVMATAGNYSFAPYSGLINVPLMSYYDIVRGSRQFSRLATAIKVKNVADSAFYAIQCVSSVGNGLGNLSRTFTAVAQLAGFGTLPIMGVIFTVVMPKLLMTTAFIGFGGELWTLAKIIKAYRGLSRKNPGDLAALVQTLKYIKDGSQIDDSRQGAQLLHKESHQESHFRGHSYNLIKLRINSLLEQLEETLIQCVEKEKENPKQSLEALMQIFEKAECTCMQVEKEISDSVRDQVVECRKMLNVIFRNGQAIVESSKSETRRHLLNHIAMIILSMVSLSASCISMFGKDRNYDQITNIMILTATSLQMCRFLFDFCVSPKKYEQLERHFISKDNDIAFIEAQDLVCDDINE